jgi:hypothetical protein
VKMPDDGATLLTPNCSNSYKVGSSLWKFRTLVPVLKISAHGQSISLFISSIEYHQFFNIFPLLHYFKITDFGNNVENLKKVGRSQ